MKIEIGESLFCINESSYSEHLTKRKEYTVANIKPDQIRLKNNNGKLVWLPDYLFTKENIPDITLINIDDEISDELNDCIEVTVFFSNGERRWTTFITLKRVQKLFNEHRTYLAGKGIIIVQKINKEIIEKTIIEMDKQNVLIEETREY